MHLIFRGRQKRGVAFHIAFLVLHNCLPHHSTVASQKDHSPPSVPRSAYGLGLISESEFIAYAKTDHIQFIDAMISNYDSHISDYTGTFYIRERSEEKMNKPQVFEFKFRQQPFSIFMQCVQNPVKVDRILHVRGQNGDKIIVHPTGLLSWIRSVEVDLNDDKTVETDLRQCNQFGIKNLLSLIKAHYANDIGSKPNSKYIGRDRVDGRECVVIEAAFGDSTMPKAKKAILKVDLGYRLPVSVTTLDSDDKILSVYEYKNLRFNMSLQDRHFTKKANHL